MSDKLTLRSKEGEERYRSISKPKVNLWEREAIFETPEYKVIANEYPYDLVHEKNVMLLTNDSPEKAFVYAKEFTEKFSGEYDQIIWNTPHNQSQGHITHVHILRFKRV